MAGADWRPHMGDTVLRRLLNSLRPFDIDCNKPRRWRGNLAGMGGSNSLELYPFAMTGTEPLMTRSTRPPRIAPLAVAAVLASMLPTAPALAAGSVEAGRVAFQRNCQNCHNDPPSASRYIPARFNPGYLRTAFIVVRDMAPYQLLSDETVNDIATYVALPNANDTDRLFDWAEGAFPTLLTPAPAPTQEISGYRYRFYSGSGVYVATKDSQVWFLDSRNPAAGIVNLGPIRNFLDQMPNGR